MMDVKLWRIGVWSVLVGGGYHLLVCFKIGLDVSSFILWFGFMDRCLKRGEMTCYGIVGVEEG